MVSMWSQQVCSITGTESHFGDVRVELHRSVDGFYCVHLCCAQPSPGGCLWRESTHTHAHVSIMTRDCKALYDQSVCEMKLTPTMLNKDGEIQAAHMSQTSCSVQEHHINPSHTEEKDQVREHLSTLRLTCMRGKEQEQTPVHHNQCTVFVCFSVYFFVCVR